MAYRIECHVCQSDTWAGKIVDLLDGHTDARGRLVCKQCGATDTAIHTITGLWEKEPEAAWNGYIKGAFRLPADSPTYVPYVLLTAEAPMGAVSGVRVSYYQNPGAAGRLTNGPGPGSAPALTREDLFQFIERLGAFGIIQPGDLEGVAHRMREDSLPYSLAQS
jgi:hypothetical protein